MPELYKRRVHGWATWIPAAPDPSHRCAPPFLGAAGSTVALRPDWECGICGRRWTPNYALAVWVEVRGPTGVQP